MSEYEYKKQIVAFLDILGFSNMVEEVNGKPEKAVKRIRFLSDTINRALDQNFSTRIVDDDEPLPSEPEFKIFSDCVCIGSNCFDDADKEQIAQNVFMFLLSLIYVQAELIDKGIVLRGAVTINFHFQNEDIVFSSALIDAHRIESKEALYPRVVVDQNVISLLRNSDSPANFPILNGIMKRDVDGLVFLDYLEIIREFDDFDPDAYEYLANHKSFVESELHKSHGQRVKEKYLWIARYHNQKVCETFDSQDVREMLEVPQELLNYRQSVFTNTAFVFCVESKRRGVEGIALVIERDYHSATKKLALYNARHGFDYEITTDEYMRWFEYKPDLDDVIGHFKENDVDPIIVID